jgi:3-hydroxyethyl bacteriochlorophyllide a dehydrogenase
MKTIAVVLEGPERLAVSRLELAESGEEDVVVDVDFSGISTGTERLLWSGTMPEFPGMGYPLVPGYESIGRISEAGARSGARIGERVFVPGARCYGEVRGLFGGTAARVVVPGSKVVALDAGTGEEGVLLALAATAHHAVAVPGARLPDLIVGHGVLGRLLARVAIALGGEPPVVWERLPARFAGATGYEVVHPDQDSRRNYHAIYDASGDATLLDALVARLAPGGEITLAGFYSTPLSFAFAPAFLREARIRVAAEWRPADLLAARDLAQAKRLSLAGLITHRLGYADAERAYRTAFGDPACVKMVLDWRGTS